MVQKGAGQPARFENPLMPDERLRTMYTAMVQMRLLEEHLRTKSGLKRSSKSLALSYGEEAARASTTLSLAAGDLICDCSETPGVDLLLGASLRELRGRTGAPAKIDETGTKDRYPRRLPLSEDGGERLQISVGAAAALKAQLAERVLLVYTRAEEVGAKRWKKTLGVAGERDLPVIFVVLPDAHGGTSKHAGDLCRRSRSWGVPGFPVDGSDAIALYRVMQEALLRSRSGGGPALIECIPFRGDGKRRSEIADPVDRLAELMVAKGAASEDWVRETRSAISKQLGRVTNR